jgi:hypothetical protein
MMAISVWTAIKNALSAKKLKVPATQEEIFFAMQRKT